MNLGNKKGYIFDLDGTLADSVAVWFEVDKKFLNSHGVFTDAAYHKHIEHLNFELAVKFLIEHFGINISVQQAEAEIIDMIKIEYAENIVLKKGAREYLDRCRKQGKKLALATSSLRECCMSLLQKEGIDDYFEVMLFSGEMKTTKRDPLIYLETARAMNLTPSECVVFEDLPMGLVTAKAVGMYTVAIVDGLSKSDLEIMQNNADEVFFEWK